MFSNVNRHCRQLAAGRRALAGTTGLVLVPQLGALVGAPAMAAPGSCPLSPAIGVAWAIQVVLPLQSVLATQLVQVLEPVQAKEPRDQG